MILPRILYSKIQGGGGRKGGEEGEKRTKREKVEGGRERIKGRRSDSEGVFILVKDLLANIGQPGFRQPIAVCFHYNSLPFLD